MPSPTRLAGTRLSIRADAAWLAWLARLADHFNCPVAFAVERALDEWAAGRNYHEPPPRRYVRQVLAPPPETVGDG